MIVADYAIAIALILGGIFTLVGSIGLLRLDTPMKRLHAPTKAVTLGVGSLLLGSMIHSFAHTDEGSLQEMLIMGFLFVTAPITAQFLAKVHMHHGVCEPLPAPPEDRIWAVQDVPEEDREMPAHDETASATARSG